MTSTPGVEEQPLSRPVKAQRLVLPEGNSAAGHLTQPLAEPAGKCVTIFIWLQRTCAALGAGDEVTTRVPGRADSIRLSLGVSRTGGQSRRAITTSAEGSLE